jgi:hypothetical protein
MLSLRIVDYSRDLIIVRHVRTISVEHFFSFFLQKKGWQEDAQEHFVEGY